VERVDAFVMGGDGTGSEVTGALAGASAGAGLTVAMAQRDRLGGECWHFGWPSTSRR